MRFTRSSTSQLDPLPTYRLRSLALGYAGRIFGRTTALNIATYRASLNSVSARQQTDGQVADAPVALYGSEVSVWAQAHLADGYRLVNELVFRPASGHFEVAKLTHHVGH